MDSARLLGNAGPAPGTSTDETRRLYRIAGLGGVGAFLAWLGQPVLVFLLIGPQGGAGGDSTRIESSRYNGAIEVVIFSAVGVGLLFMVLATWRLLGHRTSGASVAAGVGHVMGVVAAASWFLVAAEAFRLVTHSRGRLLLVVATRRLPTRRFRTKYGQSATSVQVLLGVRRPRCVLSSARPL